MRRNSEINLIGFLCVCFENNNSFHFSGFFLYFLTEKKINSTENALNEQEWYIEIVNIDIKKLI